MTSTLNSAITLVLTFTRLTDVPTKVLISHGEIYLIGYVLYSMNMFNIQRQIL